MCPNSKTYVTSLSEPQFPTCETRTKSTELSGWWPGSSDSPLGRRWQSLCTVPYYCYIEASGDSMQPELWGRPSLFPEMVWGSHPQQVQHPQHRPEGEEKRGESASAHRAGRVAKGHINNDGS